MARRCDALELCRPGEEIRTDLGKGLAEFADAGRGELAAVLVPEQLEHDLTDPAVDPCNLGEEFAVTLDHGCPDPRRGVGAG